MGVADLLYNDIMKQGFEKIEEMVIRNESESIYIDYKFVNTLFCDGPPRECRNKSVDKIDKDDKDNLGKAISGFANSDGGIIVWGVECKDRKDSQGDVPGSFQFEVNPGSRGKISPFPLNRFKALLEDCTKYCTVPVHGEVYHMVVPKVRGTEGTTKEGVVITYVKEAQYDVIRYVSNKNEQLYYMRVGSSFELMPHSVMAARFGRKPFPRIVSRMYLKNERSSQYNVYKFNCRFYLEIKNIGAGVARDYYITFNFSEKREAICFLRSAEEFHNFYYETYETNSGISRDKNFPYLISTKISCIIPPQYKKIFLFTLELDDLNRSLCEDFSIEVRTGSSDSMAEFNKLTIKGDDIFKLIECYSEYRRERTFSSRDKIQEIMAKYALDSESRN